MAAAAVGIDLGTTNCCVGIWQNPAGTDEDGRVEIIINDVGGRVTPSCVAFTEAERLIGAPAKAQAYRNAENTCDLGPMLQCLQAIATNCFHMSIAFH